MGRTLPPERLPSTIPPAAFLRASERHEVERDRAELYITAATVDDRDSGYGRQCVYWLSCPNRWGTAERVLTLGWNGYRARHVAEIREALHRVDRVGPVRLCRRRSSSGLAAWALVAPAEADAQLELGIDQGEAT